MNISNNPYEILQAATFPDGLLDFIKTQLKIPLSDTSQDDYLTALTQSAINYGELYTHRTFYNIQYRTYRTGFICFVLEKKCFELRRSKLQTLDAFQYLKNNSWIDVDSDIYYTTISNDYSNLLFFLDDILPTDADKRAQNIRIDFTAGYGVNFDDLPKDLLNAIAAHVTALYENRGDCDSAACEKFLPNESKIVYDLRKIVNITGLSCCE